MLQGRPSASRISSTTRRQSSEPWNPRSGLKPADREQLEVRQPAAALSETESSEPASLTSSLALLGAGEQVDELAAVRVDHPGYRAQRGYLASAGCNPHSTFSWPAQRPARGSSPGITWRVQWVQPIDG